MSNLTDKFPNADELNIQVQSYHTPYQPYILATEVLEELEKRLGSGKQYTTFSNKISDEEKAKVEAAGYIVTRNTIDAKNLDGSGDVYIGFQVAANETAASGDRPMVISQEETNGIEGGGGGGGSGTSNYNDLENKPQINGNVLTGNKTAANLGLQETISDLAAIRSGASKGDTAVQPSDMESALSEKQGTLTFDTVPTQSSTNPVTSGGIWTDQQRQDALEAEDRAALAEVIDGGAAGTKNLLDCSLQSIKAVTQSSAYGFSWNGNVCTSTRGVSFTINADNSITVAATNMQNDVWFKLTDFMYSAGSYVISGCPTNGSTSSYYIESDAFNYRDIGNGVSFTINSTTTDSIYIVVKSGQTFEKTFYPMLCRKALYDADPSYVPYAPALTNIILTPAVIKAVDEGAKNKLPITIQSQTVRTVPFTVNSDGSITANGTVTGGDAYLNLETTIGDKYVGMILSGGTANLKICISKGGSGQVAVYSESAEGVAIPDNATNTLFLFATNGTQLNNVTVKPMICTAADWAVSKKFVPYRPSWQEMWEMIQELQSRIHGETVDLLTEPYASHLYNKYFDDSTGQVDDSARSNRVLCDLFIDIPDDRSSYTVQAAVSDSAGQFICYFYDANENFLPSQTDTSWVDSSTFKIIPNAKKLRVLMRLSSNADIAIGNISTLKVLFR